MVPSSPTHSERQRLRKVRQVATIILLANLFIGGVKWVLGDLLLSVALKADAFHSLSDALTTFLVYLGARMAMKPADPEHPFGHGRAEFLSGFAIAVILGIVGLEFLVKAFTRILHPEAQAIPIWAILIVLSTGLIKEGMTLLSLRFGEALDSPGLKSDAFHHRSDAWTSYAVGIGLLAQGSFPWMDGLLGFGIAGYILWTAYRLVREIGSPLLGEPVPKELEDLVHQVAEEIPGLNNVHDIEIHRYGQHIEVILHVEASPEMTLREAHDLVTQLEKEVNRHIKGKVTAHIEPWVEEDSVSEDPS